jgi:hypothetical protein
MYFLPILIADNVHNLYFRQTILTKTMKKLLLPLLVMFSILTTSAQNKTSASAKLVQFARNAVLFNRNYTQEKAYLHFDNTAYFLGETIWFKAYVVNALGNQPSDMSKTLHVQLLTPEGQVIQSKKFYLSNGVCSGDLALQDSLPAGFYEIRAFTRSMINFGPEVVFSRVFPIFDQPKQEGDYSQRIMTKRKYSVPVVREKNSISSQINLAFFPEGGSLIQGLPTNVAFKAFDKEGRSLSVSGTIFDASNKQVGTFKSEHLGMGVFALDGKSSKYSVKLNSGDKDKYFSLPDILPSGIVMTCQTPAPDSIVMVIRKSNNIPEDSMALAVSCRGKIADFRQLYLSQSGASVSFNTSKFGAGIYQYTLYDTQGRVQSERLVFKYPKQVTNLTVKTDKTEYKPYERIRLSMQSTDTLNTRTGSSISLAVRDASNSNFGNGDNSSIATNLLLSSDIKGYVQDPQWYFSAKTPDRIKALDLLMMTQGWRRYPWERMAGTEPFEAPHPIEEGVLIDGVVRTNLLKKPAPDVQLTYWMRRGSTSGAGKGVTDSLGRFHFLLKFYDEWEFNIQTAVKDKVKDFRIMLNRTFSPAARYLPQVEQDVFIDNQLFSPIGLDTTSNLIGQVRYSTKLDDDAKGHKVVQLSEVVTTSARKETFFQEASRGASIAYDMKAEVDQIRDLGEAEGTPLLNYLEQTNPFFSPNLNDTTGTAYKYKAKKVVFRIYSTETQNAYQDTETRSVGELTTDDVEKVLIVEAEAPILKIDPMYDGSYVLVLIYTYTQDQRKEPQGVRKTTIQGYSVPKEFYAPTYTVQNAGLEPDFRRTLYWNPDIILDASGKADIEFFNNKTAKKYIVNAEGITSNGTLLQN